MWKAWPLALLLSTGCVDTSLTVKNDPPEVVILEPVDGAEHTAGVTITLVARAMDRETASADLELIWTSSVGGRLTGDATVTGDDHTLTLPDGLPVGEHTIEVVALDAEGASESDAIALTVLAAVEDADGDGYGAEDDCDDTDAAVNPGATEVCNGVDDDCDGDTDEDDASDASTWYADADGDAYGDAASTTTACAQPSGFVSDDTDCDDADGAVNPGATEVCNGVDDDCDGDTDEDDASDASTWYADADGDSYGDAASTATACAQPSGYVSDDTDCDDGDAAVNPAATEVCNGVDDDCDGDTDEDDASDASTWYADADGDTYGDAASTVTACAQPSGYVGDDTDCDDADGAVNPAATEVCNGVDDDCDGDTDEDDASDASTWYADADGDSYGDAASTLTACAQPSGYVGDDTDCDDADAAVNPGATEVCNGVDDDCDGNTDEDDASGASTWYADADGDSYGDAASTATACAQPSGYVGDDTDCDDTDAAISPGEPEICDDNIDNDCDGDTDECLSGTVAASGADAVIVGTATNDYVGVDVQPAGDVDGDGDDDLLIGAFGYNGGGAAFLMLGPVSGTVSVTSAYATLAPSSGAVDVGMTVGAGDLNGDGTPDLLVSHPNDNTAATSAGVVYLVHGPASGAVDLLNADGLFYGEGTTARAGLGLAQPTDLDQDGFQDLVIGARGASRGAVNNGAVYVSYGPVSGSRSLGSADGIIEGDTDGRHMGYVSASGDVDGDGLPDLLIGAQGTVNHGTQAGRAFLVTGGVVGTLSASSAHTIITGRSSEYFGSEVVIVPDLDGDGYDDAMVGAYGEATYAAGAGSVYLFNDLRSGGTVSASTRVTQFHGTGNNDYLDECGTPGDVDGDGVVDVLVGAPFDDDVVTNGGGAYLFYSPPPSGALVGQDADFIVEGDVAWTALMQGGVPAPADLNGDGAVDLVLPAYTDSQTASRSGSVYIFYGL
ncbi:MAG: FG-GAP repeat protein [Alphaproteobacteria bacterium]|nr:FG-GAP repeat protein [Alphaproteobacteria bacterium]